MFTTPPPSLYHASYNCKKKKSNTRAEGTLNLMPIKKQIVDDSEVEALYKNRQTGHEERR